MKIVNLTGHDLYLFEEDGDRMEVLPSAGRSRVTSKVVEDRRITVGDSGMEFPILRVEERTLTSVPPQEKGVLYVVSGLVAGMSDRDDVVSPARLIRDGRGGRVRGCRALLRPF